MDRPEQWTSEQVSDWAKSQGFAELANDLVDQDIDGEALLELDFQSEALRKDLRLSWGKAQKFTKALNALKQNAGATPPAALAPKAREMPPLATSPPMAVSPTVAVSSPVVVSPSRPPIPPAATMQPQVAFAPMRSPSPRRPPSHTMPPPSPRSVAHKRPGEDIVPMEELRAIPVVTPIEPGSTADKEKSKVDIDVDALEDLIELMLSQAEDGDIEVAIVSVMGKFRGGKSFLLNLLTHYFLWLEKNQSRLQHEPREMNRAYRYNPDLNNATGWLPEWLPEEISTPFKVDEKSDTMTCTKGLWILNRPFFLRKPGSDDKIAVLLLDSQGADDGVLDEAQSRAILGVTTVFSSTVIYNVKMPLDVKHVKDLSDLANIFQVAIGDIKNSNATSSFDEFSFGRLFFFLRDARFQAGATIDQCRQKLCEDTANKLDPNKAVVNKERIQQLHESFAKPFNPPFGLPHPGDAADFMKQKTTSNMRELNDNFKVLLDEFVRSSFESDFPTPVNRLLKNKPLTAHTFIEYLERIKEAFSACIVSGGDPELVLMHREELAEDAFIQSVDLLRPESCEAFPSAELEKLKAKALENFSKLLESGLTDDARARWVKRFKEFMDGHLAQRENKYMLKQQHGDRALAVVAGGLGVCIVTPLGSVVFANTLWTAVFGIVTVVGAYVRHAHDNHMNPERPSTMESFGNVTVERCQDIIKSARRMAMKVMNFAGGHANNVVSNKPNNNVPKP